MTSKDKKRTQRSKVYPDDTGDDDSLSLDQDKNSLNRTREKMKQAAVKEYTIQTLAKTKAAGTQWKQYVTTRREKSSATHTKGKNEENDGMETRKTGGIGLELDQEKAFSTVNIRNGKPTKRNAKREYNRDLIQYFARLAQSRDPDVEINLDYIETQLKSGADINCTDKHGQTVLHEAARAWHVDVARFLLEKGANINMGDSLGRTPLHVAAAVDYPVMVTLLIRKGAEKECQTKGELQTPVHYAAKNDACRSLKALIKEGCLYKTNLDYKGRSPVHLAAELDRSETTRLLLELDDPASAHTVDTEGQSAIVWMIAKMPPVARLALDQFHTTDRASRKQSFDLHKLEHRKPGQQHVFAMNAMQVAVRYRRFELIVHPVVLELIDTKWNKYGRRGAIINTVVNILFILFWTMNAVIVEYDVRYKYVMPQHWWRIVLFLLAILSTAWQLKEELTEYFQSKRLFKQWKEWRLKEIEKDLQFTHPQWPEERRYLESEKGDLDEQKPQYFTDFWNIFDWVCYFLLLVCIATHLADIIHHDDFIARLHIRIMAVTIILIWIRLLKNARAFAYLGPFIVILTHMLGDVVRFVLLYLEFFIPFACAFWMLFGGTKTPERYQGLPNPTDNTVEVEGMEDVAALLFSLFRLTLVDDYDYDGMKSVDSVMATFLCLAWLFLSAILMLNLFIALMSDTFQRVYDNAQANAIMQKAITIMGIEEGLSHDKREAFRQFIHEQNAPKVTFYDDDNAEIGGADLQKVTIQIKEQLDEMEERLSSGHYFVSAQREQSRRRNDSTSSDYRPDSQLGSSGHHFFGSGGSENLEKNLNNLQKQVNKMAAQQEEMMQRMKKDGVAFRKLLQQLLAVQAEDAELELEAEAFSPGSTANFVHNNLLTDFPGVRDDVYSWAPHTSGLPPPYPTTPARSLTMTSDAPAPAVVRRQLSRLNNTMDQERVMLERQRQQEMDQLRHQLQQQSELSSRDDVVSGSHLTIDVDDHTGHTPSGHTPAVVIRPFTGQSGQGTSNA